MRWATKDDLEGTGAVTAPNETFMVKVGDDVGRCSAKFFKDKAHLRGVVEGLVSSGNRVWLYVPLHACRYVHQRNEIVACLCLRGPEGSEPDRDRFLQAWSLAKDEADYDKKAWIHVQKYLERLDRIEKGREP